MWKQQGCLGGGTPSVLGSSHANLLLSWVEKIPQKILPGNGRLFLWRLDVVLHLSLSPGVIPAVQLWVAGHAESREPSHRYSNHPSHKHTPGQAEYSRTPLHDLVFGEDVGLAVQSSAGVSGVRSLSSDLSAAAVAA